jgi:hypothetical protein
MRAKSDTWPSQAAIPIDTLHGAPDTIISSLDKAAKIFSAIFTAPHCRNRRVENSLRRARKNGVTGNMTPRVIDRRDVVDVDEQHRGLPRMRFQCLLDDLHDITPIEQARQTVVS